MMIVLKAILAYFIWVITLTIQEGVEGICTSQGSTFNPACVKRFFENGGGESFVCVCNSTYCDGQDVLQPLSSEFAYVVTSDKTEHRFKTEQILFDPLVINIQHEINNHLDQHAPHQNEINFDYKPRIDYSFEEIRLEFELRRDREFQAVLGFGGAFTDAAGRNIACLKPEAQELLLRSYYGPTGLDYNLGRLNMGGCDFSTRPYTYCDVEDPDLKQFSLTEDDLVYKIPYVKAARLLAESEGSKSKLKMFASPWSAPAWMKTNKNLTGQGYLMREHYQTWADYFIRFLDEYAENGVEMWGLTAQNEPIDGRVPGFSFNCMGWNASSQREWIAHHLGPSLEASGYYGNIKLMILDDQRPFAPKWTKEVFEGNQEEGDLAKKYVDGVAVHWYVDTVIDLPNALDITHEQFPEKFILYTEACNGDKPWDKGVRLGDWRRGEMYLHNIIEDLNHWVVGWVDWNLALDMGGGPNWAGNFVDSPIIVNMADGEFYKQPMYYALGHISRFVSENSRRIGLDLTSFKSNEPNLKMGRSIKLLQDQEKKLDRVAFMRPGDNATVVILQNRDSEAVIKVAVKDAAGERQLNLDLAPKSFTSVLFW